MKVLSYQGPAPLMTSNFRNQPWPSPTPQRRVESQDARRGLAAAVSVMEVVGRALAKLLLKKTDCCVLFKEGTPPTRRASLGEDFYS
jgi:hypothetical protein